MGCGGSKPLGTPGTTTDIAEGTPGTTTDIGKDTTTTNTTTTTSSDNIPEGIPVDYELDGEEMDMVELVGLTRLLFFWTDSRSSYLTIPFLYAAMSFTFSLLLFYVI